MVAGNVTGVLRLGLDIYVFSINYVLSTIVTVNIETSFARSGKRAKDAEGVEILVRCVRFLRVDDYLILVQDTRPV